MPTDAFNGPSTPSSWFFWANGSSGGTRCSPSLPAKMLTIHESPKQKNTCYCVWKSNKAVRACLSHGTYIISCSWFPVVPEHQLQLNGFTLLHLLFQLLLRKINAYKWDFLQMLSAQKSSRSNFWGYRRASRPSAGVGNGPGPDSHESVSQFPPERRRTRSDWSPWLQARCGRETFIAALRCMTWPLDLTPMSRMSLSVSNSSLFPVMWFSLKRSA